MRKEAKFPERKIAMLPFYILTIHLQIDHLPTNNHGINWKDSVGYVIPYNFDGITGSIEIMKYESDGQSLTVKINNQQIRVIRTSHILNEEVKKILKIRPRMYKNHIPIIETDKDLCDFVVDKDMVQTRSYGSADKVHWRCPQCKNINYTRIKNLVRKYRNNSTLPCVFCGDGISYPEKILHNTMRQISKTYQTHKITDWSNNRIYDGYDRIGNKEIFIEIHGEQHRLRAFNYNARSRSLEEEIANDKYKKHLAKINSKKCIYIVIPAWTYRFEDIKSNIIRSLGHIYNLGIVDWNYVKNKSTSSLIVQCGELYNKHMNIGEISQSLQVDYSTVCRYLHKAAKIGICNYTINQKYAPKKVVCINNGKVFNTIKDAANWANISANSLSRYLNGRQKTAGVDPVTKSKYIWKIIV